jgi:hypothetical protein
MALFAIPNPKKNLIIDFPIEQVKHGVSHLHLVNSNYKLTKSNEVFNQYTFEALEFLSLGVYIDINLSSVSEKKTDVSIEIRRKVGTFNQSHEVTNANNHIQSIIEMLSKSILFTDEQIKELQLNFKESKDEKLSFKTADTFQKIIIYSIVAILILGIIGIFWVRNKH